MMNNGVEQFDWGDGQPYDVKPFSLENFRVACSSDPERPLEDRSWSNKPQFRYFAGQVDELGQYHSAYISELGAKTIVIEQQYVDKDFLDDFANYYVKCFKPYNRFCKRLHLFKCEFDLNDLVSYIQGKAGRLTTGILERDYLGFIVLKPLPSKYFGRSCLLTHGETAGGGWKRHFPATKDCSIGFMGTELRIRDTLAFQEQDNVLAACATTSLWVAFQRTSYMFNHAIPSPAQITRGAAEYFISNPKTFPSSGLVTNQIFHAIKSLGLSIEVPFSLVTKPDAIEDIGVLVTAIYSYLHYGLPVILGFEFLEGAHKGSKHVVTVLGYALNEESPMKGVKVSDGLSLNLRSYRINQLYAHDDGVGPFSPITIDYENNNLVTGWKEDGRNLTALPTLIAIPVYVKIRVPFEEVFGQAIIAELFLRSCLTNSKIPGLDCDFEWDLYCTDVNTLKADLKKEGKLHGKLLEYYLAYSFPKYIWRIIGTCRNEKKIELLYDATDFTSGNYLHTIITYDQLKEYFKNYAAIIKAHLRDQWNYKIIDMIADICDKVYSKE